MQYSFAQFTASPRYIQDHGAAPTRVPCPPAGQWIALCVHIFHISNEVDVRAVGDKALVTSWSTRADVDLYIGTLSETGRATYDLLTILSGRRLEGLNRLTLLTINGEGLVAVLHSLFCMTYSEYEDGMGGIWAVKGELPSEGIQTLVNLTSLQFAFNAAFQGTSQE